MDARNLAQKILKLSPSIRYVTIASLNGKIVISAHKRSVKTNLSKAESKQSLQMAARGWKTRKALAKKIGRCKYVVAEYDRVKRITLPGGKNHLIYVTTTPGANHNGLIKRIRKFR
jgi:phosphoglycerate dehydrogenase-like enzyme